MYLGRANHHNCPSAQHRRRLATFTKTAITWKLDSGGKTLGTQVRFFTSRHNINIYTWVFTSRDSYNIYIYINCVSKFHLPLSPPTHSFLSLLHPTLYYLPSVPSSCRTLSTHSRNYCTPLILAPGGVCVKRGVP